MTEYFLMQILSSSSSSVGPISDILGGIGLFFHIAKQLYCQFSIILLSLISTLVKKETVESQLYLNYFVSLAILEVYILHCENTTISSRPLKQKQRLCTNIIQQLNFGN